MAEAIENPIPNEDPTGGEVRIGTTGTFQPLLIKTFADILKDNSIDHGSEQSSPAHASVSDEDSWSEPSEFALSIPDTVYDYDSPQPFENAEFVPGVGMTATGGGEPRAGEQPAEVMDTDLGEESVLERVRRHWCSWDFSSEDELMSGGDVMEVAGEAEEEVELVEDTEVESGEESVSERVRRQWCEWDDKR
ncbi:unnamed protein product [Zymoseptoria tritici ST99CH_3D1]|uniref:Uncharacterized protein n=1 Tax=Zymoseptoria tritici (strain ST99CH_3D7) TaxID=1276538 RepID=A0A1X7RVY4_ZYMT9|nr:unnamed protein product [Zymoseptoria tritici ST99CH_3D7]SMR54929.1 unnamed protein product [Zymoseptoria tritici ST99CH_3D1]